MKRFLLVGLTIIAFFSCQKDSNNLSPSPITIQEAKNYFEKSILKKSSQNSIQGSSNQPGISFNKKALWDKAYVRDISIGKAIIVPISYLDVSPLISVDNGNKKLSLKNISYLMIYKNSLGLHAEFVTWIPEKDYLEGTAKKFKGIVIVNDWDGTFVKSFKYNGEGKYTNLKLSNSTNSGNDVKNATPDCYTVAYWVCVGDETYQSCSEKGYDTYCTESVDPAPIPVYGSGGGGGGSTPNQPSPGDYGDNPCPEITISSKGNTISIVSPCTEFTEPVDCAGVVGGSAYTSSCGCIGGTTGITKCPLCPTSIEDLKNAFPNANNTTLEKLKNIINANSDKFGINTKEQLQHFIAQAGHETGGFNTLLISENLNYSVEGLLKTWPGKFSLTDINKANPNLYANNPQKIANYVYARSDLGNGNVASGDGYKYRGRGIFQLTGKANYQAFQNFYNNIGDYPSEINLISNPDLLTSDQNIAVISALWYYKTYVLNKLQIDASTSTEAVTKKINGGRIGLADRKAKLTAAQTNIDCN